MEMPDRRRPTRSDVLSCPRCQATVTSVTLRTSHAFYCRCQSCGEIWSMPKTTNG